MTLSKDEIAQPQQLIRELVLSDTPNQETNENDNFDQISYTIKQIIENFRKINKAVKKCLLLDSLFELSLEIH